MGEVLRAIYARMREAPKKVRSGALPPNANVALVSGWKKVLSNGLPILVLKSPRPTALGSSKLRSGSFDYLAHVTSFAVRSNQITTRTIEEYRSLLRKSAGASGGSGLYGDLAARIFPSGGDRNNIPCSNAGIAIYRNQSRNVRYARWGLRFLRRIG